MYDLQTIIAMNAPRSAPVEAPTEDNEYNLGWRPVGCRCSDHQLVLVGCDCGVDDPT